ncbi:DUF6053 domain-containing protein [Lysobacter gummosus]|uniref:DUF6053 domain-containing protein n=1 Tax=Lysobacter gummosus TaxID=262324 RepID=UPI003627D3DB
MPRPPLVGVLCSCRRFFCRRPLVGGASAPMLLSQITADGTKGIGAEVPPTKAPIHSLDPR